MAFDKRKAIDNALAFTQQGRLEKAIGEYQKILEADPRDLSVINTLGDLYARTGKKGEAIDHYMSLGDTYRRDGFPAKATAVYKKVIKLDPGNLQAQTLCADLYAEQGLVAEAKQQLLLIAEQCNKAGDTKEALAVYQKVVTLDPGNVAAATKLSQLLARQGMGQDAYTHLARSAQQCLAAGQDAEALKIFRRMLQVNAQGFEAHLGLGRLLARTGSAEGIQALKAAASLPPGDAAQWASLGDGFREAGDGKRAHEAYNKALGLDIGRWEIHLRLAALAAGQRDHARAVEEVRQAMDPAVEAGRGQEVARVLKELSAIAPGEALYRRALVEVLSRLQDKLALADAYRGLGQVLEKQGDRTGTLEAYRSLQELDPRARDAAEKIASLSPPRPAAPAKAPPPPPPRPAAPTKAAPPPTTVELDPGLIALSEGEEAPAEEPGTVTLDENATDDARAYVARLEKELGGGRGEGAFDLTEAAQEGGLDAAAIAHEAEQMLGEIGAAGEEHPAEGVLELLEDSSVAAAAAGAPALTEGLALEVGEAEAPVESPPAEAEDSQVSDHVAKGEVYLKYGLVDKAIEHLQQALSLSPRNLKARQRLKEVYLDRNLADQAVKEGLSIASIFMSRGAGAEAKVELESLAKLDPANAQVREALEGLVGKAARPAARPTPRKPAAAPPAPARAPLPKQAAKARPLGEAAELAEVDSFLQQGMVEEARGALERILAADPGNAEALRRLEALEALPAAASAFEGIVPGVGTFVGGQAAETAGELGGEAAPPEPPGEAPTGEPARPFSFLPSSDDVSAVFKVAQEEGPGEAGYVDFGTDLIGEIGVGSPGDAAPLLTEILQEFRKGVREQLSAEDYETHYNLGIAYKEMELYDEAIEEFRLAAKEPGRALACANLLGLCFLAKAEPAQAVAELEQGLTLPGILSEEAWALRYDLATAYEATGDAAKAYELLSALHEEAPKFRDAKARLRDLKGRLKEPPPGRVRPAAGPAVRPAEAPTPPPPAPAAEPPGPPPQPGKSAKKKKISFI